MSCLGIALGSGGARGWCHIGVLRGLDEAGIVPDVVAGCSMGALVGAAWAAGRLDALEEWALSLTQSRMLGYVDLRFEHGGLLRGGTVREMLQDLDLPERIEDLGKPFIAVATDMSTGREVWIQRGSLFDAIRASISIPGLFSPYQVDGKWLLDGGLVNPVPSSACRALEADVTIAVNPNAKFGKLWEPRESFYDKIGRAGWVDKIPDAVRDLLKPEGESGPNSLDVVSTSIDIMTEFVRKTRSASDPPNLALEADLNDMSVLELYRARKAIREGRRIVEENRDALDKLKG